MRPKHQIKSFELIILVFVFSLLSSCEKNSDYSFDSTKHILTKVGYRVYEYNDNCRIVSSKLIDLPIQGWYDDIFYTYDSIGRLLTKKYQYGCRSCIRQPRISYYYNYQDDKIVSYKKVDVDNGRAPWVVTITELVEQEFNEFGQVVKKNHFSTDGTQISYDTLVYFNNRISEFMSIILWDNFLLSPTHHQSSHTYTYDERGNILSDQITFYSDNRYILNQYQYDDKINPLYELYVDIPSERSFYGFSVSSQNNWAIVFPASPNNVIKKTEFRSDNNETIEYNYSYTYNRYGYPTERHTLETDERITYEYTIVEE